MTRQEAIKHIRAWVLATSDLPSMQVAQALEMALTAMRGPTREMVERAWFREPYTRLEIWEREDGATVYSAKNTCMSCGQETPIGNFCYNCGAALTDEAVDEMLERWKEAVDGETD